MVGSKAIDLSGLVCMTWSLLRIHNTHKRRNSRRQGHAEVGVVYPPPLGKIKATPDSCNSGASQHDGSKDGPRDDVYALSRSLRTRREHNKLGGPSLARRMLRVSDKVHRTRRGAEALMLVSMVNVQRQGTTTGRTLWAL